MNNDRNMLTSTESWRREKRNSSIEDVWESLKEKKENQLETEKPSHLKLTGGRCLSVLSWLSHSNFTEY